MIAKLTMFAAALTFGSALAAKEPQVQTESQVAVPYGDLDLTTDNGMKVLNRRLRAAAATVCPADPLPGDMRHDIAKRCAAEALAKVAPQVAEATTAGRDARNDGRQLATR
jgi:UrcA family protein